MNIRIKDEKINDDYILQLGDVVVFDYVDRDPKIVVYSEFEQKYILRSITTMYGASGWHKTLEGLTESIKNVDYKIYKASEYELVLQRKKPLL